MLKFVDVACFQWTMIIEKEWRNDQKPKPNDKSSRMWSNIDSISYTWLTHANESHPFSTLQIKAPQSTHQIRIIRYSIPLHPWVHPCPAMQSWKVRKAMGMLGSKNYCEFKQKRCGTRIPSLCIPPNQRHLVWWQRHTYINYQLRPAWLLDWRTSFSLKMLKGSTHEMNLCLEVQKT